MLKCEKEYVKRKGNIFICVSHLHQIVQWKLWSGWSASPQSGPTSVGYWTTPSEDPGGPKTWIMGQTLEITSMNQFRPK